MITTHQIPAENFSALEAQIAKLNKRAARLKLAPLVLSVDGRETIEENRNGVTYSRVLLTVSLEGQSPVLNGWTLIAKLTPAPSGEMLVKTVPGKECPEEYRAASLLRCDHCNAARRRRDIFVVQHESGTYKVVGRNCIADFLGHASPEQLLQGAELLWTADETGREYSGGGSYVPAEWSMDLFVKASSIIIRSFGFVSRSAVANGYDGEATTYTVIRYLDPPINPQARKYWKEIFGQLQQTNEDRDIAEQALAWARSIPADSSSNYLNNLRVACCCDTVTDTTAGIVTSLIPAYRRSVEKAAEKAAEKKAAVASEHVGEVGKRQSFSLTVLGVKSIEGYYGVSTLVSFVDSSGNRLKWFASGDKTDQWEQGEACSVTATVKKHDLYQGQKETMLTRVSRA